MKSDSSKPRPTFNELLDFAEGRLDASAHRRVAEFLSASPEAVAADWAWLQDFLEKSKAVELHAMPAGLEERLNRIYAANRTEPLAEKAGNWLGSIRRIVAELVDPGLDTAFAAAGLRSKAFESTARQWTFKAGQCDIWINALARPDERYDLHGQIYGASGDIFSKGSSAQLVQEHRECGLAEIDDYGEFFIEDVPVGEYALVLAGEDSEIVCEPLEFSN